MGYVCSMKESQHPAVYLFLEAVASPLLRAVWTQSVFWIDWFWITGILQICIRFATLPCERKKWPKDFQTYSPKLVVCHGWFTPVQSVKHHLQQIQELGRAQRSKIQHRSKPSLVSDQISPTQVMQLWFCRNFSLHAIKNYRFGRCFFSVMWHH